MRMGSVRPEARATTTTPVPENTVNAAEPRVFSASSSSLVRVMVGMSMESRYTAPISSTGGRSMKLAAVAGHVAQLLEGIEAAPRGGSRQPGARGDFAQGHVRALAREGTQDLQPLGQASHHFATTRR